MYENFEDLKGKTLVKVEQVGDDVLTFETSEGVKYQLWHSQDCCESVTIDEIHGDLEDLVGSEILDASEESNNDNPKYDYPDSHTWTFYKLRTIKGSVTIRWYGYSNGYYSESVEFSKLVN